MQFAPIYPFVYKVLNPIFPGCLWEGCADTKVIALTFDDGPHPKFTPQLLETLDRYQIKAPILFGSKHTGLGYMAIFMRHFRSFQLMNLKIR
jgi:Polysaccharide deacetylase